MAKKEYLKLDIEQLKKKYGDTMIMAVSADIVTPVLKKIYTPVSDAFVRCSETLTRPLKLVINEHMKPILRCEAEVDPRCKQPIPYVVIRNNGRVFVTHRLAGDARLTGGYSIGTGGHIDAGETIVEGLRRELKEEVGLTDADLLAYMLRGYIYDDSTAVNSVHLGLVYDCVISRDDIRCLEKEKLEGQWMDARALDALYRQDRLESWSRIVYENRWW